ncbi:hypothetical protein [Paenibacillus illinoisensis]|uniref:hypothetical protein n=1 Tax=Paenibacillus illinoisensis TaxID=59845 RepID=UPI003018BA23
MCTGTIKLSLIKKVVWSANDRDIGAFKKVVWSANDRDIGAFKKFKELHSELPIYNDLFHDIEFVAAPYRDLEFRQRKMLAEWNNSRGYTDNHWNDEIANETFQ